MYFAFFKKILSNDAYFTPILEKFVLRIVLFLPKTILLEKKVEIVLIFSLLFNVLEIKNGNQREGFKSA